MAVNINTSQATYSYTYKALPSKKYIFQTNPCLFC